MMNFNEQVYQSIATEHQPYYNSGYTIPDNNATGYPVMPQPYPYLYPGVIFSNYKYLMSLNHHHFQDKMRRMTSTKHTRRKTLRHTQTLILTTMLWASLSWHNLAQVHTQVWSLPSTSTLCR
jgi:hypothetical protein